MSQAVGKKPRGAGDAKDDQIVRAGRNRAPREIGNEEADDEKSLQSDSLTPNGLFKKAGG